EVRGMRQAGMGIGAHTHNHHVLSGLSEDRQRAELVQSRALLEQELNEPIVSLAYPIRKPFAFTPTTKRLAEAAGYRLAVSYDGGCNYPGHADRYDVKRLSVDYHDSLPLFRTRQVLYSTFGRSI